MNEEREWQNPKCKRCGKEIQFIQLRNFKGEIKAHPVEADKNYIIMDTGERTEKGQYIYESKRILTSHFATCPNTEEVSKKEEPIKEEDEDKPPF